MSWRGGLSSLAILFSLVTPADGQTTDSTKYILAEEEEVVDHVQMDSITVEEERESLTEQVAKNVYSSKGMRMRSKPEITSSRGIGQTYSRDIPGGVNRYRGEFPNLLLNTSTKTLMDITDTLQDVTIAESDAIQKGSDVITTLEPDPFTGVEIDLSPFEQLSKAGFEKDEVTSSVSVRRQSSVGHIEKSIEELGIFETVRQTSFLTRYDGDVVKASLHGGIVKKNQSFDNLFAVNKYRSNDDQRNISTKAKFPDHDVEVRYNNQHGEGEEHAKTTHNGWEDDRRQIDLHNASVTITDDDVEGGILLHSIDRERDETEYENTFISLFFERDEDIEDVDITYSASMDVGEERIPSVSVHADYESDDIRVEGNISRVKDRLNPYKLDDQIYKNIPQRDLVDTISKGVLRVTREGDTAPNLTLESILLDVDTAGQMTESHPSTIRGAVFRLIAEDTYILDDALLETSLNMTKRDLEQTSKVIPDGSVPGSPTFQLSGTATYSGGKNSVNVGIDYRHGTRYVYKTREKDMGDQVFLTAGYSREVNDNVSIYAEVQNGLYPFYTNEIGVIKNGQSKVRKQNSIVSAAPDLEPIRGFPILNVGIDVTL